MLHHIVSNVIYYKLSVLKHKQDYFAHPCMIMNYHSSYFILPVLHPFQRKSCLKLKGLTPEGISSNESFIPTGENAGGRSNVYGNLLGKLAHSLLLLLLSISFSFLVILAPNLKALYLLFCFVLFFHLRLLFIERCTIGGLLCSCEYLLTELMMRWHLTAASEHFGVSLYDSSTKAT